MSTAPWVISARQGEHKEFRDPALGTRHAHNSAIPLWLSPREPLGTAHCFSCHCPHLKLPGLWLFPGRNFYKWQLCLLFHLASGRDPAPAISTCKDYSLAMEGELPSSAMGTGTIRDKSPDLKRGQHLKAKPEC